MAIKDYSTTASSNTALFPEGMSPATVNNSARQVQADVRAFYEDPEWRDYGNTPTYVSTTSFTIAGDVTARYTVGSRIRMYGSIMGTFYGTIATSAYSAPNTTIAVTMDSGALTSNLSAVALGYNATGLPIPVAALKGDFTNAVKFTNKVSFPDDGELTIASGAVTITGVNHTLDTQSDAASDDLDTINGGEDGEIAIFRIENNARAVNITSAGNINMPATVTLTNTSQEAVFIYDAALTKWQPISLPPLDQDDMAANNALLPPSQQSVKAYVDGKATSLLATQTTTSGTAFDFVIPSGTTEIVLNLNNVSLSGTDDLLIQLGDAGGVETTGYGSLCGSDTSVTSATSGFATSGLAAAIGCYGQITITLEDTNTWVATGVLRYGSVRINMLVGIKTLSDTITTLRLTRTGSNTFDGAGSANVLCIR